MRILFINKFQGKVYRGVESFVTELSNRLSKNHEVSIISGGKDSYTNWSKSIFWRFFLDKNSLEVLSFTLKEFKNIISNKYDVIFPLNGGWQSFIVRLATWISGSKMIISAQSGIGWHDRVNLYSFPDAFIPLTKYAAIWSKKVNPHVLKKIIPNGVDLNKFNLSKRKEGKLKTVLAVGAFTKDKRHELTIDAVSKTNNTKLTIVGGGGDMKKEILDYGLKKLGGDRFEVLTLPFDKMPEIYKKVDLFVYPTVPWESFGIVMLEALASNIPVVATDDPIRREIVGSAGLFVDPTDVDAYAVAIEKALNTNWGGIPRKQAEKFSWDKIANEYEELFKQM